MRQLDGNRNRASAPVAVDDRATDPHRGPTSEVRVTRAEEIDDLQGKSRRAVLQAVLGGQDPDKFVLLKSVGVIRVFRAGGAPCRHGRDAMAAGRSLQDLFLRFLVAQFFWEAVIMARASAP